ncbi:hypothetical protein MBLNU459_g8366t1 [Dothideomycetes sp. NU459]
MQHRLSKPKTINNSAYSTPSKPPSRGTDGSSKDSAGSDDLSPFAQDSPLSLSGDNYTSDTPTRSATSFLNASTNSTSSLNSSLSANRASLADFSDIDVGAAIALLQELKKRASPEDLVALHKALLPTRSNEAELRSSIPEEEGREESFAPLIRRSSLLPAGVATRTSSDVLKKYTGRTVSAQRQASRSSSRPPQPEQPLVSESTSLPTAIDTLDFAPATQTKEVARAATPSDFTYTGTYRIGSLRVTNGAASPEPSILLNNVERSGASESACENFAGDGFVTADEGDSGNEAAAPVRQPVRGSAKWLRTYGGSTEDHLRSRTRTNAVNNDENIRDSSADDTILPAARTLPRPLLRNQVSNMARDYAADCELTSSPYAEDVLYSNYASRLSTVQDLSPIDADGGGPEDALKKLNGGAQRSDGRISLGSDSSESRTDMDDRAHLRVRRPSMHAKSDSGYDSACSWQAQAKALIKEQKVDDVLKVVLGAGDRAEHDRSDDSSAIPSQSLPLDQHNQPRRPAAIVPPVALARPSIGGLPYEKHRSMPVFSRPALNVSTTSVPTMASTRTVPAETGKASAPTKQAKKLQKVRPQSQQQPSSATVQSPKDVLDGTVPGVPDATSFNFSRRLDRTPGMSHLDHTFGSVAHTASESAEAARHPRVSETLRQLNEASEDTEGSPRGRGRKQDTKVGPKDAESPPLEKRRSIFRLRGRSRSKSRKRTSAEIVQTPTEEDPMPTVSDFGTVAQSLGGSPYDIATRQFRSISGNDGARRVFHPHEISNALGGPIVGMDDATAAEFARMKSQKRAEQQQQERARSQSRSRPRHVAECAIVQDRHRSPVSPSKPSPANSSRSRSSNRRSASAHASTLARIPSLPESEGSLPRQTPTALASDEDILVGTIEIAGGVAQGRMFSSKRRSHSAASRARFSASDVETGDVTAPPEMPKVPIVATEAFVEVKTTDISIAKKSTRDGKTSEVSVEQEVLSEPDPPTSPSHDAKHPGWPGWENQARLWRERRRSLGEALLSTGRRISASDTPGPTSTETHQRYAPTTQTPRHSPAIVVSRYITPVGSELVARAQDYQEGDPYSALHHANPTDNRPTQEDIDRTDSAISSSTYHTANSSKSYSSANPRHSASYRAYHPSDAVMAAPPPPDQQGRMPAPQRRSTAPPEKSPNAVFDRYSGGLDYGWERESGFGGSAGTRAKHDTKAARKSVVLSEAYGVDLSDVPVFLRRN